MENSLFSVPPLALPAACCALHASFPYVYCANAHCPRMCSQEQIHEYRCKLLALSTARNRKYAAPAQSC